VKLADRVDQISTTIQELRRSAADGRKSRQLIDSLFRTVHSFKAAAAAEGLDDLTHTAHQFEDVLHALRTGKLTLNDEVLRAFDETINALRERSRAAALDLSNQAPDTSACDAALPAEFATLKEDERHRAAAALREGANLYAMNVEFEVNDFDERFRRLKQELENIAELISTSATMQAEKVIFKVVYASKSEKIPVQTVLQQALRAGQATASSLDKEVRFVMRTDDLLLERIVSDVLADALVHLMRNAVDHGIESRGSVIVEARTEGGKIEITVTDDGRGIAPENLPLLFQPGFSTAREVTEVSGRGVGLDVVKAAVEDVGGSVSVTSEPTKGSSFKITLPRRI